jgi:CRP-like cAMP-binding protein
MDVNELDAVGLLADLDEEARAFLADKMFEVTVPIGTHLVKAGDYAYKLFAIFDGTAAVSREGNFVDTLSPGEVFGEMALIDDIRRNADVVAVSPMRLGVLMSWDFREALDRFPEFNRRIADLIARRS